MTTISATIRALLLWLCCCAVLAACSPDTAQVYRAPGPDIEPTEVVRLQLAALRDAGRRNGDAAAAMAAAYAFASPRNQQAVGDVDAFSRMIITGYREMMTHARAVISVARRDATEAAVSVTLLMPAEPPRNYMFLLRKQQTGDCTDCWMTDAVLPLRPDSPAAMQAI